MDTLRSRSCSTSSDSVRGTSQRRNERRRVDESFLSFRPGAMDEYHDVSYGSAVSASDPSDGSVEVYGSRNSCNDNLNNNRSSCLSSSTYVNVHNSILDDTLDEDEAKSFGADEEEEEGEPLDGYAISDCPLTPLKRQNSALAAPHSGDRSCASHKLLVVTDTPPPTTPRRCVSAGSASRELACGGGASSSSSLVDLTDRLVGMCFGGVGTATPVPAPPGTPGSSRRHHIPPSPPSSYPRPALERGTSGGSFSLSGGKGHRSKTSCVIDALHLVQEDMFHFLGCSDEAGHPDASGSDLDPRRQHHWSDQSSLFCFHGRREASALLTSSSSDPDRSGDRPSRPSRLTLRERAERVRRYRAERVLPHKRTGLTLLPAVCLPSDWHPQQPPHPYRKSRSLLDEPRGGGGAASAAARLAARQRETSSRGSRGRLGSDDRMDGGGYDSDPEVGWGGSAPPAAIPIYPLIESPQLIPDDDDEPEQGAGGTGTTRPSDEYSPIDTDRIVQESLNLSWTLTWHPPNANGNPNRGRTCTTADGGGGVSPPASSSPVVVTAWIERGTLINGNTVMLEPSFMWRDAYHPNVEESRRLRRRDNQRRHKPGAAPPSPSPLLKTPTSLKLLNVARILPGAVVAEADPLAARTSCSLTVQTVDGESVVFEAASRAERDAILKRWKVVVARFVTLAILEQFEVMADEFFTPRTALAGY